MGYSILASLKMAGRAAIFGFCALPALADTACPADRRPTVEDIYPTSDVLPANLLRFYVYFSQPMQREVALEHVTLRVRSSGEPVTGAFFRSRYGLWSADGRRLTLLLDPGRVKSGLDASEALGRAFAPGEHYRLEVDSAFPASNGCGLASGVSKRFAIGAADLDKPRLDRWQLRTPRAMSRDPVSILLNGPHDHVSLAYRIRVKTGDGQPVAGSIALSANETEWRFAPQAPWSNGPYVVHVDPALEDLAGNRLTGLFDDRAGRSRVNESQSDTYELEFRPAG